MFQIGIIGGTGLDNPDLLENREEKYVETPYGKVRCMKCLRFVCELGVEKRVMCFCLLAMLVTTW